MTRTAFLLASATGCAFVVIPPATAQAHFKLIYPPASNAQNFLGDPQKLGPCGNEAPQSPTGMVTTFRPGQTIDVQLQETIYHPGHYRVALAVSSPSELPPEPPVTAGSTPCGSAPIDRAPVFPVLVDGALEHTTTLRGTQTIPVTLPSNVTCARCTLQIIEFMSEHGLNNPGGCYYHHCATIAIQGEPMAGGGGRDGGTGGAGGAGGAAVDASASGGTGGTPPASGGGGCAIAPGATPPGAVLALAVATATMCSFRRRRRA